MTEKTLQQKFDDLQADFDALLAAIGYAAGDSSSTDLENVVKDFDRRHNERIRAEVNTQQETLWTQSICYQENGHIALKFVLFGSPIGNVIGVLRNDGSTDWPVIASIHKDEAQELGQWFTETASRMT